MEYEIQVRKPEDLNTPATKQGMVWDSKLIFTRCGYWINLKLTTTGVYPFILLSKSLINKLRNRTKLVVTINAIFLINSFNLLPK